MKQYIYVIIEWVQVPDIWWFSNRLTSSDAFRCSSSTHIDRKGPCTVSRLAVKIPFASETLPPHIFGWDKDVFDCLWLGEIWNLRKQRNGFGCFLMAVLNSN